MSSSPFRDKLSDLERECDKLTCGGGSSSGSSFSLTGDRLKYLLMSIPVVVGVLLYFVKPSFMMTTTDDGDYAIDKKVFLKWVLVLSAVIAGGVYYKFK